MVGDGYVEYRKKMNLKTDEFLWPIVKRTNHKKILSLIFSAASFLFRILFKYLIRLKNLTLRYKLHIYFKIMLSYSIETLRESKSMAFGAFEIPSPWKLIKLCSSFWQRAKKASQGMVRPPLLIFSSQPPSSSSPLGIDNPGNCFSAFLWT